MTWGYLGEFWNSIASTTLNAWEYTEAWFQNVGNAVAGALGNLFEFINHSISDVFVFLGWFFENLGFIFGQLLAPIKYIFQYSRSFFDQAFVSPATTTEIWTFTTTTIEVFETIPFWTEFSIVLGIAILIIFGIAILKLFLRS